jgi:peptidoglycan/LPS O-acetylase OafA/YrhL
MASDREAGMSEREDRVPALDGLRGLAILLVLVHHGVYFNPATPTETTFARLAGGWDSWGWVGVDLFFVLSGYLITNILLRTRDRPAYFTNFYARRTLRIFPLYFLSLVLFFHLVPPLLGDITRVPPGERVYFWTYTLNFYYGLENRIPLWMSHFWSLCVEEHFYLFWPAVVYIADRRVAHVCVAILFGTALLRFGLYGMGMKPLALYCMTITRIDALALGGLIASLQRASGGIQQFRRLSMGLLAVLAVAILVLAYFTGGLYALKLPVILFGLTPIALFWGCVLLLLVSAPPRGMLDRSFSHPVLRWLGKYSYGLYVFHLPVLGYLHQALSTRDELTLGNFLPVVLGTQIPMVLLQAFLMTAISAVIAYISFHLYEQPFLSLKRHFITRVDRSPPHPTELQPEPAM